MARLQIRTNIDVQGCLDQLREAKTKLGVMRGQARDVARQVDTAQSYVLWATATESVLRSFLVEPPLWEGLHSERFWHLTRDPVMQVGWELIFQAEAQKQLDNIDRLIDDLETGVKFYASGVLAFLDTNVLLHSLPVDQVDWQEVVGRHQIIRLLLANRVIEEIDQMKYTGKGSLRDNARNVLSRLRRCIDDGCEILKDGISLEVIPAERYRLRPVDADQDILESCGMARALGGDVRIVTNDSGMRLRCRAWGIDAVEVPERFRKT